MFYDKGGKMKKKISVSGNVVHGGYYATAVFKPEGKLTKEVGERLISRFNCLYSAQLSGNYGKAINREMKTFYESEGFILQIAYSLMPSVTVAPSYLQMYKKISQEDANNIINQLETLLSGFED
jgi:hypothetical protein